MKRTIIFICNQYGPGSGALKRLCYIQDNYKDIQVHAIATTRHKNTKSFKYSYQMTQNRVKNLYWDEKPSYWRLAKYLITELNKRNDTIVVAQHTSGLLMIIFLAIARKLFILRRQKIHLNVVEVGSFLEKKTIHKLLSILAHFSADRIICISQTVLATIPIRSRRRFKYEVIFNGFDNKGLQSLEAVAPHGFAQYLLSPQKYCMITRNHPVKRNEEVFEQFCLKESVGKILFVAGEFPNTQKQYWIERSNGRIIFFGFVEPRHIRYLLDNSDVYISYSRSEGMSDALLQAATLSKKLILSNIPSFLEFSNLAANGRSRIHFIDEITELWKLDISSSTPQRYCLDWCTQEEMAKGYLRID